MVYWPGGFKGRVYPRLREAAAEKTGNHAACRHLRDRGRYACRAPRHGTRSMVGGGSGAFSGIAFAAVAVYALTGCAAKPENIAALPVSQVRYAKLSCPELRIEREVVEQRLAALSNRQRSNRTRDGLLNFLLPGLGAATPDQEGLIAQAKGEINTIERESVLRCQTVPTR